MVNLVLGLQLNYVHFFVKTEGAVQTSHAPIQELVKIDVAVYGANSHLKHDLFELVVGGLWGQSQRWWQCSEEIVKLLFSHLDASIAGDCEVDPGFHKQL